MFNGTFWRSVVVAQLVKRLLPKPVRIRSLAKLYITFLLSTVLKRLKLNKKRPEWAQFKNIMRVRFPCFDLLLCSISLHIFYIFYRKPSFLLLRIEPMVAPTINVCWQSINGLTILQLLVENILVSRCMMGAFHFCTHSRCNIRIGFRTNDLDLCMAYGLMTIFSVWV